MSGWSIEEVPSILRAFESALQVSGWSFGVRGSVPRNGYGRDLDIFAISVKPRAYLLPATMALDRIIEITGASIEIPLSRVGHSIGEAALLRCVDGRIIDIAFIY